MASLFLRTVLFMSILCTGLEPRFLNASGVQNYGSPTRAYTSNHPNSWVNKAETYFNRIQHLKTAFVQNNPDGTLSRGTLYISRPNKMRISYDTPHPFVILSDGQYIHQYDPVLDESSKIDLDLTPAAILLAESVRFSGKVGVLKITESAKDVSIKVAKIGEEEAGTLTFRFSKSPFDLKGWTVLDQNGQQIVLHLTGKKYRPASLDYSLFRLHKSRRN